MNAARPDGCKGCRNDAEDPRQAIDRFVDRLERSGSVPLASADVYRQRLDACGSCECLQNGHTCSRCGCYVEVRARLADSDCPYPYASRWRTES